MIQFTRTSNAGGILEMDGVTILLDGAGQSEDGTAPLDSLCQTHIDLMAFTHNHSSHFSPEFVRLYAALNELPKIVGPKDVASDLSEFHVITSSSQALSVQIAALPTRHMGEEYQDTSHYSFLLRGSAQVWFLGDASPLQWQNQSRLPHPDLLIAPFSYVETVWQITELFSPKKILLTHMPDPKKDIHNVWYTVASVLADHPEYTVYLPEMGEKCIIP